MFYEPPHGIGADRAARRYDRRSLPGRDQVWPVVAGGERVEKIEQALGEHQLTAKVCDLTAIA
jgi:hypothetical protein